MKNSLKYSFLMISTGLALTLTSCNKGGMSDSAPPCPAGTNRVGNACNPNTISGLGQTTRIGFYAQSSNFPANGANSSLIQGNGFQTLLRDAMGVCDREEQIGGFNCGMAACNQWARGKQDIIIMFNGSTANSARLIVRAFPEVDPYFQYTCSIPSFGQFFASLFGIYAGNSAGVFDPLDIKAATVWPINNSQGFELRSNGPTDSYAHDRLFQLQVTNGKIEDQSFNYTLYMDGGQGQMVTVASGTMVRCKSDNCGVQGL